MFRPRPILLTILLVATMLAGCVDEPSTAPAGATTEDAAATETTGSITGQVASESFDLLDGALVILRQGQQGDLGSTDAVGRFTFNGLAPGDYNLEVTAVGFEPERRNIEVRAGEVTKESFTLAPEVVKTPSFQTYEYVGFYDCAFGSLLITDTCTFVVRTAYDEYHAETGEAPPFPRDTQNNLNTFYLELGPDTTAVMSEMVWQNKAELTNEMMMLLSSTPIHNDCDCSTDDFIDVTGPSPLRAVVGSGMDKAAYPADLTVITGDEAGAKKLAERVASGDNGTSTVASRGFLPFSESFAYGQRFEIYVTVFENMVPPPEFTGIPDV